MSTGCTPRTSHGIFLSICLPIYLQLNFLNIFFWISILNQRFYWGLLAAFKFWNKGQLNARTAIANTKARIQEQVMTGPNKLDFLATQFWQAPSLITVIRSKMQFCLLAGLTSYSYISIVLAFISYSLSLSPTPSSFSSPFPQIHSPWKVHCEVWTQCFRWWPVDHLFQKCPWFDKQILDSPTSNSRNQNLWCWAPQSEFLTSIVNDAYANSFFKSTTLKALRKQVYVITG